MEENKKEKDKTALMIIIIILLFVIAILCILLIPKPKEKEEKKLPDWGEKYYNYLVNFKKNTKNTLKENKVEIVDDYKGSLYYVYEDNNEPPVLALESKPKETTEEIKQDNYLMLVLIIDGEAKEFFIKEENAKVELLYNVEQEKYYYYLIYTEGENTHFVKLADYIKYLIDSNNKYEEVIVKTDEKLIVNEKEVLKIDTMFIEPNKADIEFDFKPEEVKNLKDDLNYYITDVKKVKKELTDNSKNGVDEKLKEVQQIIIELEKQQEATLPPEDPEPTPPVDDDPGNCKGINPNASSNPCICEEFTGCPAGFKRICGIGMCEAAITEEECSKIAGSEYNNGYCMAPYL